MKIKIYLLAIISFSVALILSCKHDSSHPNTIYLTNAEKTVSTALTVDTNGGIMAITAKSSELVPNNVQATIEIDTSLIAKYNMETGKHYSALPTGSSSLSGNTLTIKAGQNISDGVNLKIATSKVLKDGISYIVPITIKSANNLQILNASKTLYIVVNKVIINTVASLANNYFTVDFSKNNELSAMTNLTFETRVLVNSFQSSSPYISSVMGIEETFLIRFGDVTVQPNQMQVAGGSTATNLSMSFSTGIWYHVAAVYNGSNLKVYVNGALAATTSATRTIDLTTSYLGGFHFGYSERGRLLNGLIGEARIWSKALTQAEIQNGMCAVDPASQGLIGYWKFNEGSGKIARDISGKGHDAIAASSVLWIPNVKCN